MSIYEESGFSSPEELEAALAAASAGLHEVTGKLKAVESTLREKKDLQKQLLAYIKTKPARDGLRAQKTEKARRAYREQHESEFIISESAARYFKAQGISKLPASKALQAEIEQLTREKNMLYKAGSVRKFITTSNVYWNSLDFTNVKEMYFSDNELERCTVKNGDMLMCEGGAYFGRTAIWNYDYDICFQNHVHRLRQYGVMELMFFYYIFYFYRNMGMMKSKGTAMPGLSSVVLHEMIIPFAPYEEQKRIVSKVEEVLPYCEKLQ